MNPSKRNGAILTAVFLFSALLSHLPVAETRFWHELTGAPAARAGRTDIGGEDLSRKIVLDGEWEFFYGRLPVSDGLAGEEPDFLIRVPGTWSSYKIGDRYLPAEGYAGYRLVLRSVSFSEPAALFIPDFGSAYRIYADGRLVAESGRVSESAEDVYTTTKSKLYPVTFSAADEHEIVVETATNRFAGLYMAPVLMRYDTAVRQSEFRQNLRMMLFGTTLFSFAVLLGAYF